MPAIHSFNSSSPMNPEIRAERTRDFAIIRQLNQAAFGQDAEAKLIDLLRPGHAFIPELSLVALLDGVIVGHILFTRIRIRHEKGKTFDSLALAPMAVLPEHQRKGLGGRLVREGLARAAGLGHRSVIVLGHEAYYPRFGFQPASKWNIRPPFEVPDSVFMALELTPGALTNVQGTVQYPKEFELV